MKVAVFQKVGVSFWYSSISFLAQPHNLSLDKQLTHFQCLCRSLNEYGEACFGGKMNKGNSKERAKLDLVRFRSGLGYKRLITFS